MLHEINYFFFRIFQKAKSKKLGRRSAEASKIFGVESLGVHFIRFQIC